MSYITTLVGPPLDTGIFDRILAIVKAVATSPSSSIISKEPVGKKGSTKVKEATKSNNTPRGFSGLLIKTAYRATIYE